jgi:phosphotransferase system  glucose/maltose/N-acetylglucosamine-specific IIC component
MLIWIIIAAFVIPLMIMYFDTKKKKFERERRAQEIKRKIRQNESDAE